jgi:hypothetical protein
MALDLIIPIIFGGYKLWKSSPSNFLQPPVTTAPPPLRFKHCPQHHVPKLLHSVYVLRLTLWSTNFSQALSSYLTRDTPGLQGKYLSLNAVSKNDRCLTQESCETLNTLWETCSVFLMLTQATRRPQ